MIDFLNRLFKMSPLGAGSAKSAPDLFGAIASNDVDGIRSAVVAGALVDGKRSDGVTPLTFACSHFAIDAVKALLELGADPDLPSSENWLPDDYAQNNSEIDSLLRAARGRRSIDAPAEANVSPIQSWTASDFSEFLEVADLHLPEGGMEFLRSRLKSTLGDEGAKVAEEALSKSNFRVLLEQLFAPEALGCAYLSADNKVMRSPMALGRYDVGFSRRRGVDLVDRFQTMFGITDALLWKLLPDQYFSRPPKRICEIGGAWGATIKHLTERFRPEEYENYEPDRYYASWAEERFGAIRMPVDGETLRGTKDDSVDLMIANNVLVFVPPIKVWSYMREMRRVIRKDGIIMFNAVLSDELSEIDLDHYLNTYFPKRQIQMVPGDIVRRTFPEPDFVSLRVPEENKYNKEYRIYKRVR